MFCLRYTQYTGENPVSAASVAGASGFACFLCCRFNATHHAAAPFLRQSPIAQLADGHWTSPYYDCGGGDVWMVTYSAPIFGVDDNNTAVFKLVNVLMTVFTLTIALSVETTVK